jgi:hypothetical protein
VEIQADGVRTGSSGSRRIPGSRDSADFHPHRVNPVEFLAEECSKSPGLIQDVRPGDTCPPVCVT